MTRPASFDAAVLACREKLRSNALSLTKDREKAEDLVQDTIEQALRSYEQYRHDTNLAGWLCVMMRNIYFTQRRRSWRLVEDPEGIHASTLAAPAEQESAIDLRDVQHSLAAIHPLYREPLLLAVDGLTYPQIAQRCGMNEGTVKSRVSRARSELRKLTA